MLHCIQTDQRISETKHSGNSWCLCLRGSCMPQQAVVLAAWAETALLTKATSCDLCGPMRAHEADGVHEAHRSLSQSFVALISDGGHCRGQVLGKALQPDSHASQRRADKHLSEIHGPLSQAGQSVVPRGTRSHQAASLHISGFMLHSTFQEVDPAHHCLPTPAPRCEQQPARFQFGLSRSKSVVPHPCKQNQLASRLLPTW